MERRTGEGEEVERVGKVAEYDDTSWRGRMVGSRMVKRAAKRGKKHRLDTT